MNDGAIAGFQYVWSDDNYRAPQAPRPVDDSVYEPVFKKPMRAKQPSRHHTVDQAHLDEIVRLLHGQEMTAREVFVAYGKLKLATVRVAVRILEMVGRIRRACIIGIGKKATVVWVAVGAKSPVPHERRSTWRDVVAFDQTTGVSRTFHSKKELAAAGFTLNAVQKCLRGTRAQHLGCLFRYVDE